MESNDTEPSRPVAGRAPLVVAMVGALLGFVFAASSTSDFMQHLDRQVHAIHCSFIPGAGAVVGESGCKTVMMSPYSSFFRETVWGGVPVSLWALAVYAFLAYRAGLLLWRGRPSRAESAFLLAATALPVLMTCIYGYLSLVKVGATCKVCVGLYVASAVVFVGALLTHLKNDERPELVGDGGRFVRWGLEGAGFVAALSATYLLFAPAADPKTALTGCGTLVSPDDAAGVMLPLPSGGASGEASVEVLDPLCPACRAFDARLSASALRDRLQLKAVLFPLDPTCNWMVTEAVHPGACAVSEALLCAAGLGVGSKDEQAALEVLRWAFKNQEGLRELASKDEAALRARIETTFPKVKGCLGGPQVKNKLTRSLRWAVANAIPVLTPQLFVGHSRMCDEDTDLGLEYTLSRMLSKQGVAARASHQPPPAPKVVPPKGAPARPAAPVPPTEKAEETDP